MPPPAPGSRCDVRKPKNTALGVSSTSDLAFSSTLSALIKSASATGAPDGTRVARPNGRTAKDDIFTTRRTGSRKRAAKDLEDTQGGNDIFAKRIHSHPDTVVGADMARSTKKLEMKAKLYRKMKRGEVLECEMPDGLVDFDAKWAKDQGQAGTGNVSESSEDDDALNDERVDFEDEYGRMRHGTKAEAERMERKKRSKLLGAEELGRLTARPVMPKALIYGDAIQTQAFQPDEQVRSKMDELAAKRDRSLTPPDMKHYEADKEYRIKGVGFYQFSKDEKVRGQEMADLEGERERTALARQQREQKKAKRKVEAEQRLRTIGAKRAEKLADEFLDGLS